MLFQPIKVLIFNNLSLQNTKKDYNRVLKLKLSKNAVLISATYHLIQLPCLHCSQDNMKSHQEKNLSWHSWAEKKHLCDKYLLFKHLLLSVYPCIAKITNEKKEIIIFKKIETFGPEWMTWSTSYPVIAITDPLNLFTISGGRSIGRFLVQ